MAIQGTQVPMYTTHIVFVFFFSFFFILKKINKIENKQTNKNTLSKAKHKTRVTQKQESKTHK